MAGGIQVSQLIDAFLGTSQAVVTAQNFILNEAQRNNYLLYAILKNYDMEEIIRGGDTITDQLILEEDSTYGPYLPLEQRVPRLSNHLTEYTVNWAFTDSRVTFSKHEKGLNQAEMYSRGARAIVFKDIIKAKWSNLIVTTNNGMEREFYAQPNAATMETVTGNTKRVPYSIFCTLHEFGAANSQTMPLSTVPPGFTTIQGINPTTFANWRTPVEFYGDGNTEINASGPGSWDGFDKSSVLYDRLRFESLAIQPEYGETERPEAFILCSRKGKSLWEHATRRSNDWLRHGASNAAYPGLNYGGIPVKWYQGMDHANVWAATGGTAFGGEDDDTVDEDGVATTNPDFQGPRFVWIVPKYFKKYIHSTHFMEAERPPQSVTQPYVQTVYFDCWHQNATRSRKRAGAVMTPFRDID